MMLYRGKVTDELEDDSTNAIAYTPPDRRGTCNQHYTSNHVYSNWSESARLSVCPSSGAVLKHALAQDY
jgi:hypothetical protein